MNSKLLQLARMILKLGQINTNKGVLISEDELAVGVEVFVEAEDGNLVPAADGEYETDTQIITVEGGIVKAIAEKEAELETESTEAVEEPMAEEEPVEETPAEPDEREMRIAELEARVAELEVENEALKAENAELKAKLEAPVAEPAEEQMKKQEKKNSGLKFRQF